MAADTASGTTGWDGLPENHNREAWHWVCWGGDPFPARWFPNAREWSLPGFFDSKSPKEMIRPGRAFTYHGPCLMRGMVDA